MGMITTYVIEPNLVSTSSFTSSPMFIEVHIIPINPNWLLPHFLDFRATCLNINCDTFHLSHKYVRALSLMHKSSQFTFTYLCRDMCNPLTSLKI